MSARDVRSEHPQPFEAPPGTRRTYVGRLLRSRRLLALLLGVAVVAAGVGWHQAWQKRTQRDDLRAELDVERSLAARQNEYVGTLLEERARLEPAARWAALWKSPAAAPVPVALPAAASPTAWGFALHDPRDGRAFVALAGLAVPAGKAACLWAELPAGPRYAGVLTLDRNGRAVLDLEPRAGLEALQGYRVSLEDARAADAPPPAAPTPEAPPPGD
jgi:hypothetical protein